MLPHRSPAVVTSVIVALAAATLGLASVTATAIMIPPTPQAKFRRRNCFNPSTSAIAAAHDLRDRVHGRNGGPPLAMAIPGYGVAEQILVGGMGNFLSIYNGVITIRILLSWFPQAQGVGALQPIYAVTDPYLNLFRGIIPPVFGLDLSPIAAFFTLSVLGRATAAVGCEVPENFRRIREQLSRRSSGRAMGLKQRLPGLASRP